MKILSLLHEAVILPEGAGIVKFVKDAENAVAGGIAEVTEDVGKLLLSIRRSAEEYEEIIEEAVEKTAEKVKEVVTGGRGGRRPRRDEAAPIEPPAAPPADPPAEKPEVKVGDEFKVEGKRFRVTEVGPEGVKTEEITE